MPSFCLGPGFEEGESGFGSYKLLYYDYMYMYLYVYNAASRALTPISIVRMAAFCIFFNFVDAGVRFNYAHSQLCYTQIFCT